MRKLIAHRYVIRQNWLAIISFCLLCYFSYHAVLGERSYIRLMSLERQIDRVSMTYDDLHGQRVALEGKVIKMRPSSLDKDLLEERVHHVLGYYHGDSQIIIR